MFLYIHVLDVIEMPQDSLARCVGRCCRHTQGGPDSHHCQCGEAGGPTGGIWDDSNW